LVRHLHSKIYGVQRTSQNFIKCYIGHHVDAGSKVTVGVGDDMWANGDCDCWAAWVSLLGDERRVYKVAMPFSGTYAYF
jgi:hypothetical protein